MLVVGRGFAGLEHARNLVIVVAHQLGKCSIQPQGDGAGGT
jgi:hypothetical protein